MQDKDFSIEMLSDREKEIYNLKENGLSERQIANKLGVSRNSVKRYWKRARKKVGVKNE